METDDAEPKTFHLRNDPIQLSIVASLDDEASLTR
jgi:hypothetical protein